VRFLLTARDRGDGRVVILHPWESGCDDSPRWDAWYPGGWGDPGGVRRVKGELVAAVRAAGPGSPVASGAFEVASAAFAALVVFAVDELATVPGAVDADLAARADAVRAWLGRRWDPARATFRDEVVVGPAGPAAPVRVVEALLPALVSERYASVALATALDDTAFGGYCGPAQVHRDEAVYDPRRYWRGPAWPPLTYLLWLALRRRGEGDGAGRLRRAAMRGATASGWAEYWHPDTGEGLGAVPQSWAALAAVMAGAPD
jgi:glycogen debranching enzyme